jgi:shikimate dehydrogenase
MLNGATRLVGIVGNPVSHSLSPRMQNAAFAAAGLDWAYVPLRVDPERLGKAVEGLVALDFAGANVTIPHKTAVLAFCDELDAVAEGAASVNTLVIRNGRVEGSSTDGLAVVDTVAAAGAHVLVLGAGGAAQAVVCALVAAGAERVTVAARRREGSERLVEHLRRAFPTARADISAAWPPDQDDATIVLNATPLRDEVPVPLRGDEQVVDLAYRPDGTPTAFVAAATRAGCPVVVDGLEVLVRQGAASFARWTGFEPPVDAMRDAVQPR